MLKKFEQCNYPITHLVSGGRAFAEHVAVQLFLDKKVPHLRIFTSSDYWSNKFGLKFNYGDNRKNFSEMEKQHHYKFDRLTGIDSLNAINMARQRGAEIKYVSRGFHACNALIAKSDFLLAITYGEKDIVKDVVAEHIVRRYLERVRKENIFDKSYHYNLND